MWSCLRGRLFCSELNAGFVLGGGGTIGGGQTRLQAGNPSCADTGVQSGADIHIQLLERCRFGRTIFYGCNNDYLDYMLQIDQTVIF